MKRNRARVYTKEEFTEKYLHLFENTNLVDKEIAKELFISTKCLWTLKKVYGVKTPLKRKNRYRITEKQFQQALENGISRRTVLKRVREYKFTIEMAITKPVRRK
jgi:hypothetical protein